MGRARIAILNVDPKTVSTKAQAEEEKKKLLDNADAIGTELDSINAELDEDSRAAEELSNDEDDQEDPDEELTDEQKVEAKKVKWERRKKKYQKYCDKGKYAKLESAHKRQVAKLQKAKDHNKPEVYIEYKQFKADFTEQLIKAAILVDKLKTAGFL
jgi:hypothetical protein